MALFPTSPTDGEYATVNGITYVYANASFSWTRVPGGGGGGGTPGGSDQQVQYNAAGSFAGSSGLTFNYTTNALAATGNITGGNLITVGLASVTGNITGGNLITAGQVVATGNITGGNIIQFGNRVAKWTTSNTTPTNSSQGDQWYDNGSDKLYLYVNDGTSNTWVDQSQTTTYSTLSVTGNATIGGTLGVTGNITGGNLTVGTGTITFGSALNSGANGTGNIGSSTGYFNTVFAKSTSSQYADLAEIYASDAEYEPGTVLIFGGDQEVTLSNIAADDKVAGVVSTNPAHLMNSAIESTHKAILALQGRVPTKVVGNVWKGAMMVSAGNGHAMACATPSVGTVIGKSLERFTGVSGTIEIVVGRM